MRDLRVKEMEEDIDYLGPYLARLGNPPLLTMTQAQKVRDQCLSEFKKLLVKRANDIQAQFDTVSTSPF